MSLASFRFESQYLRQTTEVSIILPDMQRTDDPIRFYNRNKKYKCVWLLHGGMGDNTDWWRKSRIEMYAGERDLAVVMPSAFNSYYQNWPSFGTGFNVYDFIVKELMTIIPAWFPVSSLPGDNYIFGLSMGAAGAANICSRNPEKFVGLGLLAGLVDDLHAYYEANDHAAVVPINNAGGPDAYFNSEYNTWGMIRKNADKLPPIYYACGTKDHNYTKSYVHFASYTRELGLQATFHEIQGLGHEWRFWDQSVELALEHFGLARTDAGNKY